MDRAAIDQAALGESQRERALGLVLDPVEEGRVLDAHDGAVGALDLHGESVGLGEGRVNIGGVAHRLFHIVGLERAVALLEARLVEDQVLLLPRRVPGEGFRRGGGRDRIDPIAHQAGKGDEDFVDLFASHALHRIAPDALHPTQHRSLSLLESALSADDSTGAGARLPYSLP